MYSFLDMLALFVQLNPNSDLQNVTIYAFIAKKLVFVESNLEKKQYIFAKIAVK